MEEMEKNIEEIDKEIAKIQEELNEIYKNVDFNTTDFDGVGDVYSPEGPTEDQQKKIAELQTKQKGLKKEKDEIISQIKQEEEKKKKEEEEKAKKAEIEKNIEEIDKEIAKIQEELNEIYKNVDFNTTDFDGVGDVYSPEGPTEEQQKKIAELQAKQKELKKKKDEIISPIKQEEEKQEEKAKIEAKISEWIKEGESFIYPERAEEWKKCVESSARGMYHGRDLDAAIEIMKKLESGATLNEAKRLLDSQDHSGASYGMARNIIFSFSKKGPEFWVHTARGEISPENEMKIKAKKRENAELKANQEKAKREAKISELIKEGESFIYPERAEEWKEHVEYSVRGTYQGVELDFAIEIMKKLESGATLDEAKKLLDSQDNSGASKRMVRDVIFYFSKQGPEFWEYTAREEISPENKMKIEAKKRENAELNAKQEDKKQDDKKQDDKKQEDKKQDDKKQDDKKQEDKKQEDKKQEDKKQEDKKQDDKKQEDKKEEDKKQDDKTQDDKKQDENLPAIEFRKISFSLLDNEGKYNPNYTVEYSDGMQQKFKPTKYKSKKDEREARRNIKSGIKRLFEKYNVHISGAKVKKLMKHMDIDFLTALGEYKDDSLCAQYLFATYAKLKGITGKDVDLPYALEYDTRTLNAENIDKAEAKQYNKLAKRMNKIGLVECQTEPSFLRKLFKPKKAMLANTSQSAITDTSRMTIDEQIAWYKENQNDPNFNRITYMSQLRKSGYSEEEIDQIRDGIKPSNSEQYRESKRVPKEQLTPIPKKSGNEEGKGNDKNNEEELENV